MRNLPSFKASHATQHTKKMSSIPAVANSGLGDDDNSTIVIINNGSSHISTTPGGFAPAIIHVEVCQWILYQDIKETR